MEKLLNFKQNLRAHLRFYAVTDRAWLGHQTLAEQVSAALAGNITILQLREKDLPTHEFLAEAIALKQLTDRYNVPLIINDNLEVAINSKAAGLHIGQGDMPASEARAAIGRDKILGVSAQTVEQAIAAERAGADYLGVGAIFSTSTKTDADDVSIATLSTICQNVHIPVIAIGGINVQNIHLLLNSGICGAAFVSAIFAANNITTACQNLDKILKFQ